MSYNENYESFDSSKEDSMLDNKTIPINGDVLDKIVTQFSLYQLHLVHFVEQYACQKQFAVFKHKIKKFKDDGKYCEKLSRPDKCKQKNKESKKQECIRQINLTQPLGSSIVTVTTFNNKHNHEISAKTLKFAVAYKPFSQEIINQIEFYVVYGNLLQPEYPDHIFLTQDLGNAIQKIKYEKELNLSDAASLLAKLFEFQSNDPAWFEAQKIEAESVKQQKAFAKRLAANNNQIIQDINRNLLNCGQLKSSIELGNKINSKSQDEDGQLMSEGSYKYGLYRENGHYHNTCKELN
ncbi:14453_t:CDS:2, partial [Gigaspora margarita]